MRPSKISHFIEQGYGVNGIVHVGTNIGQEIPEYRGLGIKNFIGFEPLPEAHSVFVRNYPDYQCFRVGLGATRETRVLQVTATADGQSSTVYDPNVTEGYPLTEIIKERIDIDVWRFDDFVKENNIDVSRFDTLLIDTQGMEYETLVGFGELLNKFKYLIVECSEYPIYKGGEPASVVVDYLVENGFTQDTPIQPVEDILFVRSDIKPTSDLIYRGLA